MDVPPKKPQAVEEEEKIDSDPEVENQNEKTYEEKASEK